MAVQAMNIFGASKFSEKFPTDPQKYIEFKDQDHNQNKW